MGSWRSELESEDAREIRFHGPQGRVRAEIFQGRLSMELYHGFRALGNPRERLLVRSPFVVHYGRKAELLRIESQGGRGGRAVLKLVGANAKWPKFLVDELREVFQHKVEPGSTEQSLRNSGLTNGPKAAGVPKKKPAPSPRAWTPERRERQLQTLREKGLKTKPKRRKKTRGRKKKVASGRLQDHQGQQDVPGGDPRGGEGLDPVAGGLPGQRESVDVVGQPKDFVIQA